MSVPESISGSISEYIAAWLCCVLVLVQITTCSVAQHLSTLDSV